MLPRATLRSPRCPHRSVVRRRHPFYYVGILPPAMSVGSSIPGGGRTTSWCGESMAATNSDFSKHVGLHPTASFHADRGTLALSSPG